MSTSTMVRQQLQDRRQQSTRNSDATSVSHVVQISRKGRTEDALWGQMELHKNNHRRQVLFEEPKHEKSWDWRKSRHLADEFHVVGEGVQTGTVGLSNCHLMLWSGEIQVGSPAQTFLVNFDTGSSDMWVPSSFCDSTCDAFPDWRKYNEKQSSTYSTVSFDPNEHMFDIRDGRGEWIQGVLARDIVKLGDSVVVDDQVFGQATRFLSHQTCENEEGVVGLGFSTTTMHDHTSLLGNMKTKLLHPMFSLYLAPSDDYSDARDEDLYRFDENGNIEHGQGQAPVSSSSELVFGGIDGRHYDGCLSWHDLNQNDETGNGYWDIRLDKVTLDGARLPGESMALIDSGSSFIVGPTEAIHEILADETITCYDMRTDPSTPMEIGCDDPQGFDAAMIDCEEYFPSLNFVVDGVTYRLKKEDLVFKTNTPLGVQCMLRLAPSNNTPGWILGDAFLSKYYSVYDFGNRRMAFATAANQSVTHCDTDMLWDISHKHVVREGNFDGGLVDFRGRPATLIYIGFAATILVVVLGTCIRRQRKAQRTESHRVSEFLKLSLTL